MKSEGISKNNSTHFSASGDITFQKRLEFSIRRSIYTHVGLQFNQNYNDCFFC